MNRPLVVVGDALLDVDVVGRVERLCPDAPVPVVSAVVEQPRPGGAALAAELAARDGYDVVLVTGLADDDAARRLAGLLSPRVRLLAVPYDGETPVKQRVRAEGQSIVRVDRGDVGRVSDVPALVLDDLEAALSTAAAVLVADYGRGMTGLASLRTRIGRPRRAPLVWDPHPRGAAPVHGAALVTPNRSETGTWAARLGVDPDDLDRLGALALLHHRAAGLRAAWQARALAVTLGADGALVCDGSATPAVVPGPQVRCTDPCGAGDRFAVSAAVALGQGALVSEAVQTAVGDASRFVAAGGAGSVGAPEPAGPVPGRPRASGPAVTVATGGCFDLLHAGHVATLEAARRLGDRLVVFLNSDESVRRLKGPARPVVPATDRRRVLEALECVDEVVVFDEDTPVEVLRRVRPAIWVKGGDYAGAQTPESAVVGEWGGQCVALPYLEGRSTTSLIERSLS